MNENRTPQVATLAFGAVLIALGVIFLFAGPLDLLPGLSTWPFFIIVPGVALIALAFAVGGEGGVGLSIFGSIVTATGLLLLYQDVTSHYESWAYAWALIAPGSVGFGMLVYGIGTGRSDLVRAGAITGAVGLGIFLAGAIFFEGIIGISGRVFGPAAQAIVAVAVIGLGVAVLAGTLVSRGPERTVAPPAGTGAGTGMAAGAPAGTWAPPPPQSTGPVESLALDLGPATSADIRIDFGAGRMWVGPAAPGRLVEGTFGGGAKYETAPDGRVRLWQGEQFWNWGLSGRNLWQFGIAATVPLRLQVQTGASETQIDLLETQAREIELKVGAASTRVRLPRSAGLTRFRADVGAGSLDITVPDGVAARIRTAVALGSTNINQARFPVAPGGYESPGFEAAANRVELTLQGGMGSITVR
jgi:hypothetical protein